MRFDAVSKRYGRRQALRDCSFELPRGCVAALVGPNGAGKTTLLRLATGLGRASAGRVEVLGVDPARAGMPAGASFVAQDKPLYRAFRVREMLRAAAALNTGDRWDGAHAAALVHEAGIDPAERVGDLSPGRRSRVAVAIALGRRPELLLLDEPLAELDPLARREVLGTILAAATGTGMTVLLSSHVVADIEESCDHLVLLGDGHVRLTGPIEALLDEHRLVSGSDVDAPTAASAVLHRRTTGRHSVALVRGDHGPQSVRPSLEELVLAYLKPAAADPGTSAGAAS